MVLEYMEVSKFPLFDESTIQESEHEKMFYSWKSKCNFLIQICMTITQVLLPRLAFTELSHTLTFPRRWEHGKALVSIERAEAEW